MTSTGKTVGAFAIANNTNVGSYSSGALYSGGYSVTVLDTSNNHYCHYLVSIGAMGYGANYLLDQDNFGRTADVNHPKDCGIKA